MTGMRVLLIKTSSMGDVIHTLPALTDAQAALPGISFDWVVEENFAEIPLWHPAVAEVIPVAIRRWRKSPLKTLRTGEWQRFRRRLKGRHYDLVIDAQGLLKSALLTVGIITLLAVQVFLNVAVVTNLIPTTGISLPFFSYGGTALMIQLAEMGMVLSVSRQIPAAKQG